MSTAIEKQIQQLEAGVIAPVDEFKGECRTAPPISEDASHKPVRAAVVISLAVIALAYFSIDQWERIEGLFQQAAPLSQHDTPTDVSGAPPRVAETPISGQISRRPDGQPSVTNTVSTAPLPDINSSDALFRKKWLELWAGGPIVPWGNTEQVVRKSTAVLDGLSQGKVVRNLLGVLALHRPFIAKKVVSANQGEGSVDVYHFNPESYNRYSPFVESITSIDAAQLVSFYLHLSPLFYEAYVELGYQSGDVNTLFMNTLAQIQAAPALSWNVRLIRPKVLFQFEDQELEQRSALDKQLFRMGPKNMRALQQKAREIEVELYRALNQ
ncbi:MAG: DUF3014 domain-containing protein [Gammaproteobacteria bacterium]|nr:DUF3014 domain-containing protein [Gammaproteobacteria bacterium]